MRPFSEAVIKTDLIHELESLFNVFPLAKLVELSPVIEDVIKQHVVSAISQHILCLSDDGQSFGLPGHVTVGGVSYRVSAAPELWSQTTLQIAVVNEEGPPTKRKPKCLPVTLDGVGRYNKIHIYIDPGIRLDRDRLGTLVVTVFQTGYAWLEETLIRVLSDEEVSVSREIYSYVRTILPNESLWSRIWCATVSDDKVFYLPDVKMAILTLSIIRDHASATGVSPVDHLGAFFNTLLPFDQSLTKQAFEVGHCIDVDLRAAAYRSDKSAYLIAELGIFDGESLSVYPVIHSGKAMCVLGFPTRIKAQVLPVLEGHNSELQARFTRSQSRVRRFLSLLVGSRRAFPSGRFFELAGRFVRGFLGMD